MFYRSESSCNLGVVDAAFEDEDEVKARHRPSSIDLCPGYLLQVVSRFDLAQVASLFHIGVFLCRYSKELLLSRKLPPNLNLTTSCETSTGTGLCNLSLRLLCVLVYHDFPLVMM